MEKINASAETPILKTRIHWKCPYCGQDEGLTIWLENWNVREIIDCTECGKTYILRYSIIAIIKPPQKIEGEYAPLEENDYKRSYESMRDKEKKES